jgi:hypothetical protein
MVEESEWRSLHDVVGCVLEGALKQATSAPKADIER